MKQLADSGLLALLERSPDRLERYLQQFPNDIDRLESLTELPPENRLAVESGVRAPDDIAERVAARLRVNPSLREAGEVFAGLFTIGIETAKVVLQSAEDSGPASRKPSKRKPQ